MTDWDAIYREAVSRERLVRDAAYLSITERIGDFSVKPLTLRHVIAMRVIGSPFICGGVPTIDATSSFLWQLSTEYSPTNTRGKKRFERRCRRAWRFRPDDFWRTAFGIQDFIREAYQDSPCHTVSEDPKSYYSEAAGICDAFGEAYGWVTDIVMDSPLKQVFQQLKIIRSREKVRSGNRPILSNPSDEVISRYLSEEEAASKQGAAPNFQI